MRERGRATTQDVHRANFDAQADKDIFVEPPPKDVDPNAPRQCDKLVKATDRSRHAAAPCAFRRKWEL